MENGRILSGGKEELVGYRDLVKQDAQMKEDLNSSTAEAKKLEKDIAQARKAMKDNEESTIKKRRGEVASKFDSEISKENTRLKKAQNERGKAKAAGVKERIAMETADLNAQNVELKKTIKTELKEEKLPGFAGDGFFFTLYYTKGFGEVMLCILMVVLFFLVLPGAVFFVLHHFVPGIAEAMNMYVLLALCYFVIVAICFVTYVIIGNNTKHKHNDKLREIRKLRDSITANKRQIRKIASAIKTDKNEEMYGLGDFDERIANSEGTISGIESDKEAALKEFDELTAPSIITEIEDRELPAIVEMENRKTEVAAHINELEYSIKQLGLTLSTQYEAYIGKEYSNIGKIDELIAVIDQGEAATIGEAINVLKNKESNKN